MLKEFESIDDALNFFAGCEDGQVEVPEFEKIIVRFVGKGRN